MAAGKPLSSAEMTRVCLIFLLMRNAASVSSQFNGYNCDANYHSRYPGEKDTLLPLLPMAVKHTGKALTHGTTILRVQNAATLVTKKYSYSYMICVLNSFKFT